ncbi:MAG: hypothetical protein FWC97_11205, partial [Treponema sp.]|nr:hypothetical protein [Treponema sp.]
EQAGTYILKFFREDFRRGYIINDYVQVIAGEAPTAGTGWFSAPFDRSRVIAQPRWPTAVEEAEMVRGHDGTLRHPSPTQPDPVPAPSIIPETQIAHPAVIPPFPTDPLFPPPTELTPPIITEPVTPTEPTLPIPEIVQETIPPDMLLQRARETFDAGNVAGAIALVDQFMVFFPGGTDEAFWLYGQFYEANSPSRNILLSLDFYRRLVREFPQSSRLPDARRRIAHIERFFITIQ